MSDLQGKELRYLVMNSTEPLVFHKVLDWNLQKWSLQDWQHILKDELLNFRCGKNSSTKEPQWERTNETVTSTFKDFIEFTTKPQEKWMYFDYKYLKDWFKNIDEITQNISYAKFGFPEISSDDCTIWIGSQGSHTPCHIDTYGCNLVAQIYGRKQWLLFPPSEDLKATRIPYEESSIYSKLNFFSPSLQEFQSINVSNCCRRIILEPGDLLVVPHRWWHFVENLETAISINSWLPLPQDDLRRIEESLTELIVSQFIKDLPDSSKKTILNPNSDHVMTDGATFSSYVSLVHKCKEAYACKTFKKKRVQEDDNSDIKNFQLSDIINKYQFIQNIPILSSSEFLKHIEQQWNRFGNVSNDNYENGELKEILDLAEVFTDPDVISLICDKLLLK